jgi:hypothetical protein
LPLPAKSRRGTRPSPKRNTPKRAPLTAPPGTLPAPTAPTPHLSSTILRKVSRSATEEEDSDYFSNYFWLFRTRMPVLRRPEFTVTGSISIGPQVLYLETSAGTSDHE